MEGGNSDCGSWEETDRWVERKEAFGGTSYSSSSAYMEMAWLTEQSCRKTEFILPGMRGNSKRRGLSMLFCSNVGFGTAFKKGMGPGISWNIWHNNKHDFKKVTLLETVHTTRLHRSCPAQCKARATVRATPELPKEFDTNTFRDALESTAEWLGQIENPNHTPRTQRQARVSLWFFYQTMRHWSIF